MNSIYRERAHLVALMSAIFGGVKAPATDVENPGWWLVFIEIPDRGWQWSWHVSPHDADLLENIPTVAASDPRAQWDGTTSEDKYRQMNDLAKCLAGLQAA